MNNKITLFVLLTGMSAAMFAQRPMTFRTEAVAKPGLVTRNARSGAHVQQKGMDMFSIGKTHISNTPVVKVLKAGEAENPYGEEVVIMEEDFSKLESGSLESPDLKTSLNLPVGTEKYPWWNMDPKWTTLPNWGANNAYSAGGCVFLNADLYNQQASINTPLLDVSGYCGIVTVSFKARTLTGTSSGLMVECAETYNMSPTWDIKPSVFMPDITSEWRTYEVTFYGGGPTTIFNLVQTIQGPIYIDDIKVYQIDQYVDTPVTLPHSNYKGNSFDANWEAVDGAEAYLLNVYSLDENSDVVDFIVDKRVEGTSFTVEGIESGKTYYYTLRAVKGTHESMETQPVEVFDLEAPVLNDVEEVKDGVYTASWNDVPTAERYNYWAYNVRTAEDDGEFVVTDENFDGVKDADGNLTGLTLDNPSYNTYSELYLADLSQAGWRGTHYMPYTDYICVDAWQYIYGQGDAGLISPELDLSKDNGKINLSIKLYGELAEMADQDGNPVYVPTQAAVALFNYDESIGDYVQAELVYPEGVDAEWKTFNVTLTKGTSRSTIGIYGVTAPGNLYIDDLKITQNYKKGETLLEPFLFKQYCEDTSLEVVVPMKVVNAPVYHKVSAVKAKGDSYGALYKESQFSDLKLVSENVTASIDDNMLNEEATVTSVNGMLCIVNPNSEAVVVYSVGGNTVFSDNSGRRNINVSLGNKGIYIVKIGDKVVKVRN